jgi:hypothetical protein
MSSLCVRNSEYFSRIALRELSDVAEKLKGVETVDDDGTALAGELKCAVYASADSRIA